MSLTIIQNKDYSPYDPKTDKFISISLHREKYIPYYRTYDAISYDELLQLIGHARINHWKGLDLSNCRLQTLPRELWELTDLRVLFLGNDNPKRNNNRNTINIIPQAIEKLQNLQVLSISGLSCSINKNSPLNLPHLHCLDFTDCDFEEFPRAFLIPTVEEIGLTIRSDCLPSSFVTTFPNLSILYMYHTNIKTLPDNIVLLKKLKHIMLSHTQITSLPASMLNMPNLSRIYLEDTPLAQTIPPEILRQSAQEIIKYVINQQSSAPKEYFNESKMIIVGQGQVGKTSLLKRLVENKFDEQQSTEGISISKWEYQWGHKDIRLNIWDFGGQEIYHSTHQFFLTKRSLYLLVWDVLAEKEYGRIDYWLRTIQSLADDSPIIIVVNKCDNNIGRIERLDIDEYKSKYPQIIDILYVSCKDNKNIDRLSTLIKKTASELPLMRMRWLKTWMNVRRRIEKEAQKRDSISYSYYFDICKKSAITDEEEALSLIKYLNDLGIVLYYHDDALLKDLVILSSEWGTDAVYKVLDEQERRLKDKNGILSIEDLPFIWDDRKKYPQKYYPHLLNLMEKFQLAFKINIKTYLIAELLNNQSFDLGWEFNKLNTLSFRYEYDFLPAGIMTRFIVSANKYLFIEGTTRQCWRKGAYLVYNSARALVRLYDDISNHYIQIDVIGENDTDKKALLFIIRCKLVEINSRFNKIVITPKVPCCCSEKCQFLFDYKMLLAAREKKIPSIQCHYSWALVPLSSLMYSTSIATHTQQFEGVFHDLIGSSKNLHALADLCLESFPEYGYTRPTEKDLYMDYTQFLFSQIYK